MKTTDLLAWNNMTAASVIQIGQILAVYRPSGSPVAAEADPQKQGRKVEHVVTSGQNPSTIAKRYGVNVKELFDWNGWTKTPILHIGDRLTIYTD